jgi:lipoprotein-anchoring transpeptidase ErfK/SrfK
MPRTSDSKRLLAAAQAAVLAAAVMLSLSPAAGASPTRVPPIDVVGAGTLNWRQVAVRARPSEEARRIAVLHDFRSGFRPQYVLALSKRMHPRTGRPSWYRISIPGRPNGRSGWLPAAAVELRPVTKRLVVDRSARRFAFWDHGRRLRTGKVAVGKPGAETPIGLFYVQSKFVPTTPILGAYAFETSAYSRLTDWPGGGVVGVHGTPWPWLLGQAVSHGCVRMHNRDVLWLRSRVPEGMPIKIVP